MSIPDAAIEAAAHVIHPGYTYPVGWAMRMAEAAIEAAMPAIREALAQEIETRAEAASVAALTPRARSPYRHESDVLSDAARIVRGGAA